MIDTKPTARKPQTHCAGQLQDSYPYSKNPVVPIFKARTNIQDVYKEHVV